MQRQFNRRSALAAIGGVTLSGLIAPKTKAACCYFAAKDKDVNQPAQKAFINWDPKREKESFTVQPKFEGNATEFGMVIPTPSQPKLDEMPRDFFKELAVFTILEPMPLDKYKSINQFRRFAFGAAPNSVTLSKKSVEVLEEGVVGSLDYKIIRAEDAKDLFDWLDEHKYQYSGDEKSLDHYIQKQWYFTVMKIDPKQMKPRADGTYEGNITPTRFTFGSPELIYPLRITQISVKDFTEALFYVQSPDKVDLQDSFSYQFTWQPMWAQAMGFAVKRTEKEEEWLKHIESHLPEYAKTVAQLQGDDMKPATLEWTKKIEKKELGIIEGTEKYNRDAPEEDVKNLKLLRGYVQEGQVITKFRKVFHKSEMHDDLKIVRATAGGRPDDTAYYEILPTSPP
jgi:Uncharacterized protein conserved in bacteria (DUF2330)